MRPSLPVALLAALIAGCGSLPASRTGPTETPPSAEAVIQAAQLNDLLSALTRVVNGAPAVQAEEMAQARQDYEQARQGHDALRYGLMLAAPAHPARRRNARCRAVMSEKPTTIFGERCASA